MCLADSGNNRILKVDSDGNVTRIAGTGVAGYFGDGGDAVNAQLNFPLGVAVDSEGIVYVADMCNNEVRQITSGGIISRFAGSGYWGTCGDGSLPVYAGVGWPQDVAADSYGNIAIESNGVVRKVFQGPAYCGTITPTVTLVSSAYSAPYDQGATITATVSPPYQGGYPYTGNVDFYEGDNLIYSAPVDADGHATFSTADLTPPLGLGLYAITAQYEGDDNHSAADAAAPLLEEIDPEVTITNFPGNTVPEATEIDLGSEVTGQGPGDTVTYAWTATDSSGEEIASGDDATFSFTPLDAGGDTVTLSATVDGVTGTSEQTLNVSATTTTTLTPSTANPNFGDWVTFTASVAFVAPRVGTPTGTVSFYDETADTYLDTESLDGWGDAAFSTSDLSTGNHTILATYSRDGSLTTSQGTTVVAVAANTLSIYNVSLDTSVLEGGIATLSGDVSGLDGAGFTLSIDWGANQRADTLTFPPDPDNPTAEQPFTLTHHYIDSPTVPLGSSCDVHIVATPNDGRPAVPYDPISIAIQHVRPSVNILGQVSVSPGVPTTVSAVVADPGQYGSFTYSWTVWGDATLDGPANGPSVTFIPGGHSGCGVNLTVTDEDGGTVQGGLTIPGGIYAQDSPSVTISETDPGHTVLAGQPAHFLISVPGGSPNHGTVYVYYRTQDGVYNATPDPNTDAIANRDYTASGDECLPFYYNPDANDGAGGYDAQPPIEVQTTDVPYPVPSTVAAKTFSVVVDCVYDEYAATPCAAAAWATATIDPGLRIRSDNNYDGTVNGTDDSLNSIQPNALNLEGNGNRTEVDLAASVPGDGQYEVVVPAVAGVEFWNAADGGTQLQPDGSGDVIDTAFTGTYTRTIWVSAATATMLSATATAQSGRNGDLQIHALLRNQANATLQDRWIGANRPVEVLYAVDGTGDTADMDDNVHQFEEAYWGQGNIDRHYYDGPRNILTGTDSTEIVYHVEGQVHRDYITARQRHRLLVIDMLGFSRGAVIVGTVAQDLNTVRISATNYVIDLAAHQHIDVHWVGLFDAVSQMGRGVDAPHSAWATQFSNNVRWHYHIIHTATTELDYYNRNPLYNPNLPFPEYFAENTLFPTETRFGIDYRYDRDATLPRPAGDPRQPPNGGTKVVSMHHEVGFDAATLPIMIAAARPHGVPVQGSPVPQE